MGVRGPALTLGLETKSVLNVGIRLCSTIATSTAAYSIPFSATAIGLFTDFTRGFGVPISVYTFAHTSVCTRSFVHNGQIDNISRKFVIG